MSAALENITNLLKPYRDAVAKEFPSTYLTVCALINKSGDVHISVSVWQEFHLLSETATNPLNDAETIRLLVRELRRKWDIENQISQFRKKAEGAAV